MNSPATRTSRGSLIVVILALLAVGVVVSNAPLSDDRGAQAYVVQPGDDYYTISSVLGSGDVAAGAAYLARANGELPAAPLRPGRVLLFEPSAIAEIVVDPAGVDATTTVPRAAQDRPELLAGAAVERVEVNGVMQTWDEATTAFEAAVGQPITIARRFSPDFPGTFAEVEAFAVDTGVRDRFISVKGDPTFEQWMTFLDSVPADGFDTWVTINHEPENDGDDMTPDVFKAKLALMLSAIRETARPDLHPAAVLMTWLERDDDPNSSSAAWFPDEPAAFTLGIDPYDICGCNAFPDLVEPTLALWRDAGGVDWAVTETGTKQTGEAGAAWIDGMFDFCRSDASCVGPMWFHSAIGPVGDWWLDDPAMQVAFGAQLAAG